MPEPQSHTAVGHGGPAASGRHPAANAAAVMVGLAAASAAALGVNLTVIAGYGPAAHGRVTLVLATAYLGTLLCDLGLASKAGVRRIARLRGREPVRLGQVVGQNLGILVTLAYLGAVIVFLGSPLLGHVLDVPGWALRQAAIWLFAGAGIRACFMVFIGFERMGYLLVLSPASELTRLVWAGLCIWAGLGLDWLYVGWSVSWVVSLAVTAALAAGVLHQAGISLRIVWPWHQVRKSAVLIRHSLAYHVPLLANQALGPVLWLGVGLTLDWIGPGVGDAGGGGVGQAAAHASVSVLQVCFTLALIVRIVSQGLATSVFPVYSRGASNEFRDAQRHDMSRRALAFLAATVVLCLGGYLTFGQWALSLIDAFGDTKTINHVYETGYPTLLVLTAAVGIDAFRLQFDQLLMSGRHVGVVTRGELVKLALLIGLIPGGTWLGMRSGAVDADFGAALAVLVVVAVIAVARGYSTRKRGIWG